MKEEIIETWLQSPVTMDGEEKQKNRFNVDKSNVRWNHFSCSKGFVMVPNVLLRYHEELGIDEKELIFLLKLSSHKETFLVHDNMLIEGNQKTAQRRRHSLKIKGLIDFNQRRESYYDKDGKKCWKTLGFTYDLSVINRKLEELTYKIMEDRNLFAENKIVQAEDRNGSEDRQQSPAYNTKKKTMQNTKKNSSTTTFFNKSPAFNFKSSANKFMDIIAAYNSNVDPLYIVQKADLLALECFAYPELLLQYIPYWTQFIGTHKDYLYYSNRRDEYDKKNTAQIYVMINHWNNFYKFAKRKIQSEKDLKLAFGESL